MAAPAKFTVATGFRRISATRILRGSGVNENMNGLLRQYFPPKRTDLFRVISGRA
jgi:hypothetical protein